MKKPIIHRLLSFLLACVMLAQTAVGVAGWYPDILPATHDHQSLHHAEMEHHLATHHEGEHAAVGEHHHHCCHVSTVGVAVPVNTLPLPPVESAALIPAFSAEPYHSPLTDLLIRPPIA